MSIANTDTSHVDITPTPRILRTLGDIPFEAWQCLAELTDNSIDAFSEANTQGINIENPQIDITWSRDASPSASEIIIEDNGIGMPLSELQKAAKAGYSNNDPIHNLGLFGMGFNIATARLGEETVFLSTQSGDSEWVGIRIDFDELINSGTFSAPVIREHKEDPAISGTKIIVRKLKDGVLRELKNKMATIKRRLETIYSTILEKQAIQILLQGNSLSTRPHCVWGETRYVVRKGRQIEAIQRIDRDLGSSYFDQIRNRYLSEDEVCDLEITLRKGGLLPEGVVERSRRLKGWVGIQRYSHTSDFGIDFIRNGRKILSSDKSIFNFENPATGTLEPEYPIELGSTIGGRIVGEIHVDYLIPTYQKNGFDTSGQAWRLTSEAIRGAGPILPKHRKAFNYDGENESPLGLLVSGYRRSDPGTKNLAINNSLAKQFAEEFRKKNPDYIGDDRWYKAAQEADRSRGEGGAQTTPVNTGETPSDNPDDYGPNTILDDFPSQTTDSITVEPKAQTSNRDDLIKKSVKEESLSGKYAYGSTSPFVVTAWRVVDEPIRLLGERVPCNIFMDGVELDFFYDETHSVLTEYPLTPKQLLLYALAEKFAVRESGISVQKAFLGLISNHLEDERIITNRLQDRAHAIMDLIKESLPSLLSHRFEKACNVLNEVPADVEKLALTLIEESNDLFQAFQNKTEKAHQALAYINNNSLVRLVNEMPEEFLDNKVFNLPYIQINIGDEATIGRIKATSLSKVTTYLRDVCNLFEGKSLNKYELIRFANTLSILEGLLVL
jgi:arsenate reductase-like glutaredoxin family protein